MQGDGAVEWYVDVAEAFGASREVVAKPAGVSEDCLYLNVWSPESDASARLPVMVFVHGGGNAGGWSYEPNYLGHNLAARGVVVVTIAYRLGPFGFFSHPALGDGEQEAIANFGLLDIRAAFDWVRENIRQFGGDPGKVTAFGESAGALNLLDLLLSDIAGGRTESSLFRRLIVQSIGGPLVQRQTLPEEQELGAQLVGHLGLGPGVTAEELRSVAAEDLLAAAAKMPADYYPDGIIDGRLLLEQPLVTLAAASARGVEIILGTNADEWLMYLDEGSGEAELDRWLSENAAGQAAALRAALAAVTDPKKALDRLWTAREMVCPSRALAAAVAEAGGRSWLYHFTRQRPGAGGAKLGAYHGAELPYVFDTHDAWLPTQAADRSLTGAVMDYWVGFARLGVPAVDGRPQWPVYGSEGGRVMELGDHIGAVEPFDEALCLVVGPQ
jgi:para-nitrobenzyl esterase